jgi:hypothetical protein
MKSEKRINIVAVAAFLLFSVNSTSFASSEQAYSQCPKISESMRRLACFDSFSESKDTIQSTTPTIKQALDPVGGEGEYIPLRAALYSPQSREGLSAHETNRMLARTDSNDINSLYMDAELSLKYPILTPLVESLFDLTGFQLEKKPRLFIAFSSRFSQYVGSRESSPVVARRYNPELFVRAWTDSNDSYWDFGFGHESNGQQVDSERAFAELEQFYIDQNETPAFARDSISRGWDYLAVDWNKQWETGFLPSLKGFTTAHIELRRYLSDGFLQGAPEEYNDWEEQGSEPKTRDEYDGLKFSVQYNLIDELCIIACFDRIELTHRTGYADPFSRNTTSLELTTSLLGIPFHLWAMSGYNSDLIDYYDYSNSWGIGVEFTR